MVYAIMVDYFMWSDEKGEYRQPCYLGVEGKHKLLVFSEERNADTKYFDTAKEAGEYVDKHFSKQGICYENVRIIQIRED